MKAGFYYLKVCINRGQNTFIFDSQYTTQSLRVNLSEGTMVKQCRKYVDHVLWTQWAFPMGSGKA